MYVYVQKNSKGSSLIRIVFAHAEENRHAFVYEYMHTLFFTTIMLIAVGVQKKKEKRKTKN
jgi:phosphoribosyl-ATP pyrophosphohydrolase